MRKFSKGALFRISVSFWCVWKLLLTPPPFLSGAKFLMDHIVEYHEKLLKSHETFVSHKLAKVSLGGPSGVPDCFWHRKTMFNWGFTYFASFLSHNTSELPCTLLLVFPNLRGIENFLCIRKSNTFPVNFFGWQNKKYRTGVCEFLLVLRNNCYCMFQNNILGKTVGEEVRKSL